MSENTHHALSHHTLSSTQRAIIGTTLALIAIWILVRILLLPMVSHGHDLISRFVVW